LFLPRLSAVLALTALTLLAADTPPSALPTPDIKADEPAVTFRSDVSLARVDAQVLDRANRPVQGLPAEDFVLRINGKPQEIHNFQSEKMPVDILLLLDVSRSMEPHVQRMASASHQALSALGDQDRVGIMVFDRSTRVRLPFSSSRQDAESELGRVLDQETFEGGTDITRGLLEAAGYMSQNARPGARRAIVILTDDQTERDRDDAAVSRALTHADCVLSALLAPDAMQSGTGGESLLDDDDIRELFGGLIPPGFGSLAFRSLAAGGPHTQSAGTTRIANQSGGDSMPVEDASAFENTLARIRERYALYFYLPDGVQAGDEGTVEVELSDAARQRFPGAEVRYRRSFLAPKISGGSDKPRGF